MSTKTKIAKEVAKAVLKVAGKNKSAEKLLDRSTPEEKKSCRACAKRIKKDAEWVVSRRFVCVSCGHRTHVHCAAGGDPSRRTCAACG